MELRDKKVTVIGLGISGRAASLLLKQKGARVYATDSAETEKVAATAEELKTKGVLVETGRHTEAFIKGSDFVVISPGVPESSSAIAIADENFIPIISEIELASRFCKAPIIAVTGTNGKSTVVTLIGLMLEVSGKETVVCGNIGDAFSSRIPDITGNKVVVLEVSSFQLKRVRGFKPKVAVITNITQNHFDRHSDFEEYLDSKKNIYRKQAKEDFCILNYDDDNLRKLEKDPHSEVLFASRDKQVRGAYLDYGGLVFNIDRELLKVCAVGDIKLKGEHNMSNVICSCLSAYLLGARPSDMKKALSQFQGLDHRFQYIGEIEGVAFVDDSKATTVDACRAALSSCRGKAILIAGGRDKGSDFNKIRTALEERVRALVLIGEAKGKIRAALQGAVEMYDAADMDSAVSLARSIAEKGDTVLLSPMCASFDMYKDYEERGDLFKEAVLRLRTMSLKK